MTKYDVIMTCSQIKLYCVSNKFSQPVTKEEQTYADRLLVGEHLQESQAM